MILRSLLIGAALVCAVPVCAQDKPSVGKYLAEGYEVIRSEFGSQFLQFMLKKDKTLVWCSVQVQNGETSSCRTIK